MSDRFKNWVFVFLAFLCLGSTVLNTHVCSDLLTNLHHEQDSLRNVLSSQVYAGHVAVVAKHEAERATAIEKQYADLAGQYIAAMESLNGMSRLEENLKFQSLCLQDAINYIGQLSRYIQGNNLPIPVFEVTLDPEPPPSGLDDNGDPINPLETAPVIP